MNVAIKNYTLGLSSGSTKGGVIMKYKVYFQGFSYVEADSEDEAVEFYQDDLIYSEQEVTLVEEIDDFVVEV